MLCSLINEYCRKDSSCPSFASGDPCWSTNDVSCCRRNDKSRCTYCSVYLSALHWKETDELRVGRGWNLPVMSGSSDSATLF